MAKASERSADPPDGPANPAGGECREGEFGVENRAGAKAAARIGRQHAQPFGRQVEDVGEQVPDAVRRLGPDMDGGAVLGGIIVGGDGARLHEGDDLAAVDHLDADHPRRARERGVGHGMVAGHPFEAEVAGQVVPHARRARPQRRLGLDRRRQGLVIDGHELGRRPRLGHRLGHDKGDRVADMANLAPCQWPMGRVRHLGAVAIGQGIGRGAGEGGDGPHARRGQVFAGIDREHAGGGTGRLDIDAAQAGMGVGRAGHGGVGLAREAEVVGELARAREEALVLDPAHRLADPLAHDSPQFGAGRAPRSGLVLTSKMLTRMTAASESGQKEPGR